jgi:hypothetical protein
MSTVYLDDVLDEISEEGDRARAKFGDQLNLSDPEWLAILVEEVGEAANVLNERSLDSTRKDPLGIGFSLTERREQLRGEVIQVAAVAA